MNSARHPARGESMTLTIERCDDSELWTRVGAEANADQPEYAAGRVIWPPYARPHNDGADLSVVASVGGQPVARLQRRGETVLDVSVIPEHRRRGVGTALMEFALRDARERGVRSVWPHLYID